MLNNLKDMLSFFAQQDDFNMAVKFTAGRFDFSTRLIEKDYLCSLMLMYLFSIEDLELIFKGGTLLSKVHANFNRLSEDLDFVIPMPRNAARSQRSKSMYPVKVLLNDVSKDLPIFSIKKPLTGHNNSYQYTMALAYRSNITREEDQILIDIGLRDELLIPEQHVSARTVLVDQFLNNDKVAPFSITGLHPQEAYAEKTRAALCRRELAIRDFYDLDYAWKNGLIAFDNASFLSLVQKKVQHETRFHDFTDPESIQVLQAKIKTELEPTLKGSSLADFNLERVLKKINVFANELVLEHDAA